MLTRKQATCDYWASDTLATGPDLRVSSLRGLFLYAVQELLVAMLSSLLITDTKPEAKQLLV